MSLPHEIAGHKLRAQVAATAKRQPDTWAFVELKTLLNAEFSPLQAQALFSDFLADAGLPTDPTFGPLRQMVRLATGREVFAPAGPAVIAGSRLPGGQRSSEAKVAAREVFACRLTDTTTYGRSNLRRDAGGFFADLQGNEAGRYPTMWWFDPVISACRGPDFLFDAPPEPVMQLDAAIDLTGAFATGWGHAVLEFAPQLLLLEAWDAVPKTVPVLVDADLPASHYDLFRHLTGGRRELIPLGFRQAARLRHLWAASSPEFWPALRMPGLSFRPELSSINPAALARLMGLAPPTPRTEGPKRIFLARGVRHTRLADQEAVASMLAKAGFVMVYPERLSFAEQLALVAGATHVAGPGGSQMLLAMLFGPPDLKVLMFHLPDLEETPSLTATAEARGQKVLVVPGEMSEPLPSMPYNSQYRITPAQLDAALAEWL